jgi:hypothetical protein
VSTIKTGTVGVIGGALCRCSCEHTFLAEGSPHARFRRALVSGNATVALGAAAELPQLSLADALALCLVLADADPQRYARAAVRWAARYFVELPRVDVAEAQLVLGLLGALAGPRALAAGRGLAEVCAARHRGDLAEEVRRWQVERGAR